MGACCSSDKAAAATDDCDSSAASPSAQVVSIHGELHQYSLPVFASQVLQFEQQEEESNSPNNNSSVLLCNSDSLCYDEYIQALDFSHQLQPNQIYFLLPLSKLQSPLSSKDMAALAVKATIAIQNAAAKKDCRRNMARISPLVNLQQLSADQSGGPGTEPPPVKIKPGASSGPSPGGLPRSDSVRKFQRCTSRRAKLAVRSFRLRLSTIYEGSVM